MILIFQPIALTFIAAIFIAATIYLISLIGLIGSLRYQARSKMSAYHNLKKIWNGITTDNVKLSWFILLISLSLYWVIYCFVKGHFEEGELIEGVFIELSGMLFDVLILVLLMNWMQSKGERSQRIQQLRDEIENFRHWENDESKFRHQANINRLISLGISQIDANCCYLPGANFIGKDLSYSRFDSANLIKSCFEGSIIENADFSSAQLIEAELQSTIFTNSKLINTNLKRANLNNVVFKNTDLSFAILNDAEGLTYNQLKQCKSLLGIQGLPPEIELELRNNGFHHLFLEVPPVLASLSSY